LLHAAREGRRLARNAGMPHGCVRGLRSQEAGAKMPFELPIRALNHKLEICQIPLSPSKLWELTRQNES
jgi:hypothetical protein